MRIQTHAFLILCPLLGISCGTSSTREPSPRAEAYAAEGLHIDKIQPHRPANHSNSITNIAHLSKDESQAGASMIAQIRFDTALV